MFHRLAVSNLAVVATLFVAISGLVVNSTPLKRQVCSNTAKRQEWRAMSDDKKSQYIEAVQCLQKVPPTGSISEAKSLFDDFQGVHINLATQIHLVGQFLPWHRRFLYIFEAALRDNCDFNGALPYWDWSIDIDADGTIAKSPVFDATHGFGGNGIDIPGYAGPSGSLSNVPGWVPGSSTGGGCVPDGPFASYNLSLGPGTVPTNHCLTRAFNNQFPSALSSAQVANTTKQQDFENFRIELEGRPVTPLPKLHDQGHYQIGGEMFDFYSSPGDPLFYLHHANLDRIWWQWQDVPARLYQISGRSTVNPPYVNVTLEFPLDMQQLAPQVLIRDVMDVDLLCYTYI